MKTASKRPKTVLKPRTTPAFEKAFQNLNKAQKKAVDTIEGPVMVIAGPGTGKTQTLAMRVANILARTHARPSNILCLTFTKSGATAMRERLRHLIGADAYGITIDTIHGFSNGIITSHPEVFEEFATLEQISDIERYRAVNRIIDELMPDFTLVSRKNPYSRTKQILDRMSVLKREGMIDRERLLRISKEYDVVMQGKSKEGTKQYEKNVRTARKFREFLEVFFRYQEMLESSGRYDYEDMILRVIQALKEEDWLMASLQERYLYILLDEVQDTNGAQWRLIELLTHDPTGQAHPNLFVVGDDDQAIFRFQGAELTNILSFHDRFPSAPLITLTESYRCTREILDAAGSLIAHNEERLVGKIEGIEKNLVSASKKSGKSPMLLRAPSDMSEPWLIADLIGERLANGIPPEEIAIIVQTNSELQPIYDVIRSRGIPVEMSGKVDLLSHTLVKQAMAILKAIHSPADNHLFASALSCPCFSLPAVDIARFCALHREQKKSLVDLIISLRHNELEVSLLERESLIAAGEFLLDLHQRLPHRTIVETLEHILRKSGLLNEDGDELDIIDVAVAQEFFDRIKQRAYEDPTFSIHSLLSDLSFYENDEYRDLRLTYDLPHLTEKGVRLMTAHKSKGLEFRTVILANFREGHWGGRRPPPSIAIPEDLLFGWEADQKKFEKHQDERRVTYVAMTRAKEELLFLCPMEQTSGDGLSNISPSSFFSEAGELPEESREIRSPEKASTLLHPILRNRKEETVAFLKEQIAHFSLSPSALNDFLEDPELFVEKHLLRLPEARNPAYAYGNAIHHVLAEWGLSLKGNDPWDQAMLLTKFAEHLKLREVLTDAERGRLLHLGREALTRFHDASKNHTPIIHKVEFDVKTHHKDIPLKGKIDRIDLLAKGQAECIVYDYKTGKPKSPAEIEKLGYKRQLLFYDLLIRGAEPLLQPQEYVLSFVGEEADGPKEERYVFSDADRRELEGLIETVWGKIVALDFTKI